MTAAELAVLQDMPPALTDMSGWPQERVQIYRLVKENGCKIETIAKEVGFSRPQVSRFLNDNAFRPSEDFFAAVRKYLMRLGLWEEERRQEPVSQYKTKISQMEFVITEGWRRSWFVMDTAMKNRNFGMIVGPSGCGKTAAISTWMDMDANFDRAVLITANGCMTRKSILRRIAKSVGIGSSADADTLIERICAALSERPRLLIFDEADQLAAEYKLEVLRSILDGGQCGIVLIGNEDLSEYILQIAVDKRKLSRIHNRFGAYQQVSMPTRPEAERMLEGYNLAPGAKDYLVNVIRRRSGDGGIRVAKTMLGIVLEAMGDKLITEDLLRSTALKSAVLSSNFHGH